MIHAVRYNWLDYWYNNSIDKNRKKANRVKYNLYNILILPFAGILIFPTIIWILFDFKTAVHLLTSAFSTAPIILTGNFVFYIVCYCYMIFVYKKRKNEFTKKIEENKLTPIKKSSLNSLYEVVETLKKKMGINDCEIALWKSYSKTVLPSIEEKNKKFNLVLPIGFFKIYALDKEMAESLIAHELGHVKHNDCHLWHFSYLFSRVMKQVILPISIIFLIINCLSTFFYFITYGIIVGKMAIYVQACMVYFIIYSVRQTKKSRNLSEELADTAAIIYSNGKKLKMVFEKYLKDVNEIEGLHPDKKERLNQIENKLKVVQHSSIRKKILTKINN